jgi:hypothetical protein
MAATTSAAGDSGPAASSLHRILSAVAVVGFLATFRGVWISTTAFSST